MSRADDLRSLAANLREIGFCLCGVGPADAPPEKCATCRRADEAEAEAIERGESS